MTPKERCEIDMGKTIKLTSSVVGSGAMGSQIAMVCALAGLPVHCKILNEKVLIKQRRFYKIKWTDGLKKDDTQGKKWIVHLTASNLLKY